VRQNQGKDIKNIFNGLSLNCGTLTFFKADFNLFYMYKLSTLENKIIPLFFQFLSKFFGYTLNSDVKKLLKSTFPNACFSSVPLSRIHENVDRLTTMGFTKEQIRY